MATYPRERQEFLNWCEAHGPVWAANAEEIGLTVGQVAGLTSATTEMRTRVTAQTTAKQAARAATESVLEAERTLRSTVSQLVRAIRLHAIQKDDPNVYVVAQIPPPASGHSPVPPPGQPTDFRVELNPSGSITIRWKARHPEGSDRVIYFVQRKLVGEANFSLLGGTGERSFEDTTLPAGVDGATYIITAQRGQVSGPPSQQLAVTFGVAGGGLGFRIASVTTGEGAGGEMGPQRLAA